MLDQDQESLVVGGRYHLIRQIGVGGTSRVYEAIHHLTQERVAIKVIPLQTVKSDTRTVARFLREAKLSQEVTHDGIVKVLDAWIEKDERCCLVMELLNGVSLRAALRAGEVTRLQVTSWISNILEALEVAHRAGVIHRDLKPENIFIHLPLREEKDTMISSEQYYFDEHSGQMVLIENTDFDLNNTTSEVTEEQVIGHPRDFYRCLNERSSDVQIKILDFGLSRTLMEPSITQSGHFVGTPWYMSPEQVLSPKTCTSQTDLWSVGVILYEALCDGVPFQGANLPAVCLSISEDEVNLSNINNIYPLAVDLCSCILRCLERDLSKRFRSAATLKYDLDAALAQFASCEISQDPIESQLYPTPSTMTSEAVSEKKASIPPVLLNTSHSPVDDSLLSRDDGDDSLFLGMTLSCLRMTLSCLRMTLSCLRMTL